MGIISGLGSFRGQFGDHFRVGDHFGVGIISGAVQASLDSDTLVDKLQMPQHVISTLHTTTPHLSP